MDKKYVISLPIDGQLDRAIKADTVRTKVSRADVVRLALRTYYKLVAKPRQAAK